VSDASLFIRLDLDEGVMASHKRKELMIYSTNKKILFLCEILSAICYLLWSDALRYTPYALRFRTRGRLAGLRPYARRRKLAAFVLRMPLAVFSLLHWGIRTGTF